VGRRGVLGRDLPPGRRREVHDDLMRCQITDDALIVEAACVAGADRIMPKTSATAMRLTGSGS
jgi:hypothetical protein